MLKISDVAKRLGVSRETVRTWLLSGDLRGFHPRQRGMWLIPADELERFLHEGTAPPPG